jgi:hypothetical protein
LRGRYERGKYSHAIERKQDQKERDEQDSLLDAYLQAIKGASRAAKAA